MTPEEMSARKTGFTQEKLPSSRSVFENTKRKAIQNLTDAAKPPNQNISKKVNIAIHISFIHSNKKRPF